MIYPMPTSHSRPLGISRCTTCASTLLLDGGGTELFAIIKPNGALHVHDSCQK